MWLTERDGQMVAWIGRMGAASVGQVAERFGMSRPAAYQRLRMLAQDGLLELRLVLHARPGLYWATRKGLRWQRLGRLPVFTVGAVGFEHAYQVAHAAVELHRALPGWDQVGEREIRLIEVDRSELFASAQLADVKGRKAFHRPDLALVMPGVGVMAVEVELTEKSPAKLKAICKGYARARHVERVYYLALPGPARAVQRAVAATRTEDRIRVLDLNDIPTLASELSMRANPTRHIDNRPGDATAKIGGDESRGVGKLLDGGPLLEHRQW